MVSTSPLPRPPPLYIYTVKTYPHLASLSISKSLVVSSTPSTSSPLHPCVKHRFWLDFLSWLWWISTKYILKLSQNQIYPSCKPGEIIVECTLYIIHIISCNTPIDDIKSNTQYFYVFCDRVLTHSMVSMEHSHTTYHQFGFRSRSHADRLSIKLTIFDLSSA